MFLSGLVRDGSDRRGQSEVIGVVLLLSVTVIGVTAVVASGAAVLGDAQTDSRIAQTENSMSQMSSKAGLVALGQSGTRAFDLGNLGDGTVDVRKDAGTVTVSHVDEANNREELHRGSYGAVVATVGDTEIAYQGGGVWRKDDDRSVMVSPPEYHYQQRTLTFPIVRVVGDGHANGPVRGRLTGAGGTGSIYPDGTVERANPLEDGKVVIEIQSEYYQGWYDFFEARTEGTVEIDDTNRTVTVELDIPFQTSIENAVTTTSPDGITTNGADKPNPHREGVNYPSARGNYYASGEGIPETLTVNTGGQPVNVVIDGSFEPADIVINGGGTVSLYVNGEFNLQGNDAINEGGDPSQLFVYIHSSASSSQQGTPSFTGVIYAPNTDLTLGGTTDFEGALIADSLHINGNAGTFTYDPSLSAFDIEITNSPDTITYLHVTENEVEVELR
ncbi:type IV pilin N-terminal domain-containing protein [Halalkalicoccus ordinarius]|uniref:type IV pilin N-terminal domain-containing protein n=1 Tax=Halalkalicoccus ordinarius TaxID=3116651 RepID=UPI00300F434B